MSTSDPELDAELRLVVAAVGDGAHHVDVLCERTGLPLSVVQSDLLRLTLMGLVRTDRAGAIDIVSS
jgi:predicted Rossmann fold nucleotide-binding protein DprA/Smf involved in DNA uptake